MAYNNDPFCWLLTYLTTVPDSALLVPIFISETATSSYPFCYWKLVRPPLGFSVYWLISSSFVVPISSFVLAAPMKLVEFSSWPTAKIWFTHGKLPINTLIKILFLTLHFFLWTFLLTKAPKHSWFSILPVLVFWSILFSFACSISLRCH